MLYGSRKVCVLEVKNGPYQVRQNALHGAISEKWH